MDSQRPKTLILGVGNILLSDEGVGVRVIEYLRKQSHPEDIELFDGGTGGADLIDVLSDRNTVIIVDAVQSPLPPGTILKLTPEDLMPSSQNSLSLHDLDIPQTLKMTQLLRCAPQRVVCFGVVPERLSPGMELSQTVAALVASISEKALNEAVSAQS